VCLFKRENDMNLTLILQSEARKESSTFNVLLTLILLVLSSVILVRRAMLLSLSLEHESLKFMESPAMQNPFQIDCIHAVKQRVGEWMNRVR
jgi:hypothetical protein